VDVLSPQQRHFNMSRIRSKDTKPELVLRRALHARGLRFRLHKEGLPGRPDLVFRKFRAVLFVNGCFWHGHANCKRFSPPVSSALYWAAKIERNQLRDGAARLELGELGWRILTVWECALIGTQRQPLESVIDACVDFLSGNADGCELRGVPPP